MKYILTAQGERYMARVNAEMMRMQLTQVKVGSGTAPDPGQLTDLVSPKQTIQIEKKEQYGNQATLKCLLTNLQVEEEYLLQQCGVYAYDAVDGQEMLVIIGQDEQGERVPAAQDRVVQWVINIAWKISSAAEIVFDISVNDFVTKGYLQDQMEGMRRVMIGPESTELENDTILLIVEQDFDAVEYTNLTFAGAEPSGGENWADTGAGQLMRQAGAGTGTMTEEDGQKILQGKLHVGAQPKDGSTFFAQIKNE